jgi:hypothetical protein
MSLPLQVNTQLQYTFLYLIQEGTHTLFSFSRAPLQTTVRLDEDISILLSSC